MTTEECDAPDVYKQAYIQASKEDIVITQSPVGMPGRAILNPFLKKIKEGERPAIRACFQCLEHCDIKTIPYCITNACLLYTSILVNNAGITRDNLVMKMSEEDFDAVIQTNLKGVFNCIHHISRQMLKQRSGRIINISSVSGVLGNAGQANYCAAKAGVIGITKSVAREMASRGITVNAIAPGFIRTEMTEDVYKRQAGTGRQ